MFSRLYNKLKNALFFAVFTIYISFFISIALYSHNVLFDDYASKVHSLSNKYSKNFDLKLLEIENAVYSFVNSKKIIEAVESKEYSIDMHNVLGEMSSRNLSIKAATILLRNDLVYYSDNRHDMTFLVDALSEQFAQYDDQNITKTTWLLYNPSFFPGYHLICAVPLKRGENILGYIFADCSINRLLEHLDYSDNFFLEGASVFLVYNDNQYCVYGKHVNISQYDFSGAVISGNKILTNIMLEQSDMQLLMSIPTGNVFNQVCQIYIFLFLTLIILLTLCRNEAHKIIRQIVSNLTKLNTSITDYISKKKGETNAQNFNSR